MRAPFPQAKTEPPSTWSITYVPSGAAIHHEIDSGPDAPEIRLLIGEPELAELAMKPDVATKIVAVLNQAIHECEDKRPTGE